MSEVLESLEKRLAELIQYDAEQGGNPKHRVSVKQGFRCLARDAIAALRAAEDRARGMEESLQEFREFVDQWARAYPESVFPVISSADWKRVDEVLGKDGVPSLTNISGNNMRHVITNVKEQMDAALKSTESEP